jgi:hypothetical protein
MTRIPESLRNEIRHSLAGLPGAEFRAAADELAFRYSVTLKRLYEFTKDFRRRKKRNDAGRSSFPIEIMDALGARALQKHYCAKDAIEEAIQAGDLAPEQAPSARTLNKWMADHGIAVTDRDKGLSRIKSKYGPTLKMRGGRRQEARCVNFVWQMDSTTGPSFWIPDIDGSIKWESPLSCSKNKLGKQGRSDHFPLKLVSCVDDKSRYRFAWCYAGINSHNMLSFVLKAMLPKTTDLFLDCPGRPEFWPAAGDPQWADLSQDPMYTKNVVKSLAWIRPSVLPLRGVPDCFYADNGSEISFGVFASALDKLNVRKLPRLSGSSNSTGKVENTFNVYKPFFERIRGREYSLYQINLGLLDYCIKLNAETHTQTGTSPALAWVSDQKKTIRDLPKDNELLRFLAYTPISRSINYFYEFSYDGIVFRLPSDREPFNELCHRKVEIYINQLEFARAKNGVAPWPQMAVAWKESIHWFDASLAKAPENIVSLGEEFKSVPETRGEKKYQELMDSQVKELEVPGFYNEKYSKLRFPQEEGTPAEIDFGVQVSGRKRSLWQAISDFQEARIFDDPVAEDDRQWLIDQLFKDTDEVFESQVSELLSGVREGRVAFRKLQIMGGTNGSKAKAAS